MAVSDILSTIQSPLGYGDFGAGERHGSHERTWSKKTSSLTRFVTVAITPEEQSLPNLYVAEVWMGADDGERYARYPFARFDGVKLEKDDERELWKKKLQQAVETAAECANTLTLSELHNVHVQRRPPAATELGHA